jgi:hypothetical protein
MKTAIQEMIEHIQINATKFSVMNTYNMLKVIEPYLEKEKEQIIDAYRIAAINNTDKQKWPNLDNEYFEICANEYFEKHFNQNK